MVSCPPKGDGESGGDVPTVMMTVVDTIPKEEIEACRRICEDEVGAVYRVREYIKD